MIREKRRRNITSLHWHFKFVSLQTFASPISVYWFINCFLQLKLMLCLSLLLTHSLTHTTLIVQPCNPLWPIWHLSCCLPHPFQLSWHPTHACEPLPTLCNLHGTSCAPPCSLLHLLWPTWYVLCILPNLHCSFPAPLCSPRFPQQQLLTCWPAWNF